MPKYVTMTDSDLISAVIRAIRSVSPQKKYKPDSLTKEETDAVITYLKTKLCLDEEQADFLFQNYRSVSGIAKKLYLLRHPDSPTGFIDLLILRRRIWRNLTGMTVLTSVMLFFSVFLTALSLIFLPDAIYPALTFGAIVLLIALNVYLPIILRNRWMLTKTLPTAPESFEGRLKRILYRTEAVYDMSHASRVSVYHLILAVEHDGKTLYYTYSLLNENVCLNYRNRRAVQRALDAIPKDKSYLFTVEGAALVSIRPTVIRQSISAIRSAT